MTTDSSKKYKDTLIATIDIISKITVTIGFGFAAWAFNKIESHDQSIIELRTIVSEQIKYQNDKNNNMHNEFNKFQVQLDRRFTDLERQLIDQTTKLDRFMERVWTNVKAQEQTEDTR